MNSINDINSYKSNIAFKSRLSSEKCLKKAFDDAFVMCENTEDMLIAGRFLKNILTILNDGEDKFIKITETGINSCGNVKKYRLFTDGNITAEALPSIQTETETPLMKFLNNVIAKSYFGQEKVYVSPWAEYIHDTKTDLSFYEKYYNKLIDKIAQKKYLNKDTTALENRLEMCNQLHEDALCGLIEAEQRYMVNVKEGLKAASERIFKNN